MIGDNHIMSNQPRILVFGAAKPGIGQAVTKAAMSEGYEVIGLTNPADLDETEAYRNSTPISWMTVDTFDATATRDKLETIDGVTGVIHADFYFYMERAENLDLEEWRKSLTANLTIPKVVGFIAQTQWRTTCRSIVFITSSEANTGSFGAHAYAATKAAVHNLTKSLSNASAGSTRYNSVAAGWIGGVMDTDEVFEKSRAITPLSRLGRPEEIANVALWLLGESSSFVNGATVYADGGYTGVDTISKFEYESEFGPVG